MEKQQSAPLDTKMRPCQRTGANSWGLCAEPPSVTLRRSVLRLADGAVLLDATRRL